eukprot:scaffold165072_cov22-Tisochrysis_lutea.AAC.1
MPELICCSASVLRASAVKDLCSGPQCQGGLHSAVSGMLRHSMYTAAVGSLHSSNSWLAQSTGWQGLSAWNETNFGQRLIVATSNVSNAL